MKKIIVMPKFKSESAEADWWASPDGRSYVKNKYSENRQNKVNAEGSSLVAKLSNKPSVQIAIRLPEADIAKAREIAARKGIGYQTLLKMFVREGLLREGG